MPKSFNQKLKLLYLYDILIKKSDEDHPITMKTIIQELGRLGIEAERKSIYDDFEALRTYGVDVIVIKSKTTSYFASHIDFELPELKLLVDAVQSSKFITHKKSSELIKKIQNLVSVHKARDLQRQVYVSGRVKTANEEIYYNVDNIHSAISDNMKISFKYFEVTRDKKMIFKKDGENYTVSPMALCWHDENYYLLAFDGEILKHYRVDKMNKVSILEEKRGHTDLFEKVDMSKYTEKVFSMFGGREETVKLGFSNKLSGVVFDRFSKNVSVIPIDDDSFSIIVKVEISPQFFGWMAGLGADAYIISPKEVKEEYLNHLESIIKTERNLTL